jgi:hypothetical protein
LAVFLAEYRETGAKPGMNPFPCAFAVFGERVAGEMTR